jgi:hypothetical protein
MVAKGNVDKHRHSVSGLKVQEREKWGRDTARERYGSLKYENSPPPQPKDLTAPQDPSNARAPGYRNDHGNDWVRGAGESATGKPNFDSVGRKGYHGRR